MNAYKLGTMTRAYLQCALWSSTDDDGTPLDDGRDESDFAPESLKLAEETCKRFAEMHRDDLDETGADDDQHGHDLWLTRNGHGAGFWDRGYGDVGDKLTELAHNLGTSDCYVGDDGLVYLS